MQRQYADLTLYKENNRWCFEDIAQEFLDMTGFSVKEIQHQFSNNILEFFSAKDAAEINDLFNHFVQGINFSPRAYSLHNAYNHAIDVLLQFHKESSHAEKIQLIIIDLSVETNRTYALKRRLESLEASSPGGLCQFLFNEQCTIVWHNQKFLEIIGYTREQFMEELNGEASYIHPDDIPIIVRQFEEINGKSGQATATEIRIIRRDGEVRTLISTFAYTGEIYQKEPYKGTPVFYSSGVDITEIKRAQELELIAERFRIAMEQTSNCVWEYNIAERKIIASQSLQKVTGLVGDIENIPDSLIDSKIVHKDSIEECRNLFTDWIQGVEKTENTIKIRSINGEYIWAKISATVLFDELGLPFKAIALMEDVTESYRLELRYREEEHRRMAMTFNQIFACQLNISKNKVLEVNTQIFIDYQEDLSRASALVQQYASKFIHPNDRASYLQGFSLQNIQENFSRGNTEITLDYRVVNADGKYDWQQTNVHTIQEPSRGELWAYFYIKDITKQKTDELELRRHAERDSLTNLYNRYTVELKCREIIGNNTDDKLLAMLSMDLDGFKNVNDSYGHLCGDDVLQNVSKLLTSIFTRKEALLGRLGGDEFLLLLLNCVDLEMVKQKAQLLCNEIAHAFGKPYNISTSVGIAIAPADGVDYESLYQAADLALYEAKRLGKNCHVFYNKSMSVQNSLNKQSVSREWLLDESNDIIYVADLYNYDLLYMNKNTKRIFNIEDDSYKGKKCFKVLQHKDQPCDFCTNHLLSRDTFYTWQYRNPTINQTLFLKDRIVDWYGRAARIELATDITTIDVQSKIMTEQLHIDAAIIRCYRNFNQEGSFETAIESSMHIIGELYQADRVLLLRPNSQTNTFLIRYIWLRDGVNHPIVSEEEWEKITVDFGKLKKGAAYHLNDYNELLETSPELYPFYKRNNIFCQRVLPLYLEGVVAGFVVLDNPMKLREDVTALETLGYCVAAEITKLKLTERIEQLSSYDSLTGLYNRTQFIAYMEKIPLRKIRSLGVVMVDLSDLGKINRLHGYKEGDRAIKVVANLLSDIFTSDSVFRIRSERFIAVYENCSEKRLLSQAQLVINDSTTLSNYKINVGYAWADDKASFAKLMEQARKMLLTKSIQKSIE